MIKSFRHKGLKLSYENSDRRRLPPGYADKIERMLAPLDQATDPTDLNLPGFRLHALKGDLADFWSMSVSANWRMIFRWDAGHALDVDLIDYH
jgi:proteic killer suppression protein